MAEHARSTRVVRSLRNGQITIPADFRKALGIEADTLLQLSLSGRELHLKPVRVSERAEGAAWMKELYELFAPVREEAERFSEEEIDAAIDEAVSAVRRSHA